MEKYADLHRVAAQIKKFFYQEKAEQLRKPYRPAERYQRQEFWDKAAELCIDLGADPYSFVRAAFLYHSVSGGPFPQMMTGKAAAGWYRTYQKLYATQEGQSVYVDEVRDLFTSAIKVAFVKKGLGQLRAMMIQMSNSNMFHPVPCVILFPGDLEIGRLYGKQALLILQGNPRFWEALQEMGYAEQDLWKTMNQLEKVNK